MNEFVLTPLAEQELNDIWEYHAAQDLDLADRVIEEVFETLTGLARKRLFGHPRPDLTDKPLLFKYLRDRYVVIYRTDRTPLEVICIAGGVQDIQALLEAR